MIAALDRLTIDLRTEQHPTDPVRGAALLYRSVGRLLPIACLDLCQRDARRGPICGFVSAVSGYDP